MGDAKLLTIWISIMPKAPKAGGFPVLQLYVSEVKPENGFIKNAENTKIFKK